MIDNPTCIIILFFFRYVEVFEASSKDVARAKVPSQQCWNYGIGYIIIISNY